MTNSPIKEDFLHFVWRTKKLPYHHYETTDGRKLEIIDFGLYNVDSGPDFFNAKIKVGDTIWAGNIEMHVFSSDWNKHLHHNDKAYENVILHVVYENDRDIRLTKAKDAIPTLELKGKIPKQYIEQYFTLMQSQSSIPCRTLIHHADIQKVNLWKYTLTTERLNSKSQYVSNVFNESGFDWEETLYIILGKYFGSKVNTVPFEMLVRSLPLSIINKNKDSLLVLDALLFGQAGMLSADYKDDYYGQLKSEYSFYRQKYQLRPIDAVAWKFSKLRPHNFPTVRIAQFSGLMFKNYFLFSYIKEAEDIAQVRDLLKSGVSEYWNDHYRFDVACTPTSGNAGSDFIDVLIINAVIPVLYYYGKYTDDDRFTDKSIFWLEKIKSEKNTIIAQWAEVGISAKSAFDTQALLQLKTEYCNKFRCLSCRIGHEIINK
jgi:hypothetical protein